MYIVLSRLKIFDDRLLLLLLLLLFFQVSAAYNHKRFSKHTNLGWWMISMASFYSI